MKWWDLNDNELILVIAKAMGPQFWNRRHEVTSMIRYRRKMVEWWEAIDVLLNGRVAVAA